ncbi:hypothetical protein [Streptomyces sp. A012304]|nr:hypothetical protein [Streptomyces sp. A012304]
MGTMPEGRILFDRVNSLKHRYSPITHEQRTPVNALINAMPQPEGKGGRG